MDITSNELDDWQNTTKSVKDRNQFLFDTKTLSDCSFIVGIKPNIQIMKAHKLLLASSSPVFESMFYRDMAEKKHVSVPDVQPEIFNILLEYIYTDTLSLESVDKAIALCYTAKKYIMCSLVERCKSYLSSNLTADNAFAVYELAKLLDEEALMAKCLYFICCNIQEVLTGRDFDVKIDTLDMIFEQESLDIDSELDLFSSLRRYICENNINIETEISCNSNEWLKIKDSLKKIRFMALTPRQFTDVPATSNLLREGEKLAIVMNICSPNSAIPMPDGFSLERSRPVPGKLFSISCSQRNRDRKSEFKVSENFTFVYRFSSIKNIFVHGIEVPTQKQIGQCVSYKESLTIGIRGINEGRLLDHDDISTEKCNSVRKIDFCPPVFVREKEEHKIEVILKKKGTYVGLQPIEAVFNNGILIEPEIDQSFGFIRTISFSFYVDEGQGILYR